MDTYIITEKQNIHSTRDGVEIKAKSMTAAKRAASRAQFFCGTVLTIHTTAGVLLASKSEGVWTDHDEYSL